MSREILPSGGREVRVAIGFPSDRNVAEGNLGFQIVAGILRTARGIQCERFYLPEGSSHADLRFHEDRLRTEPSGRSLASMDLVLFSLSYEGDAVAVPALLEAGGLPAFAGERRAGHPLVVGGGALVMINPEPLAPFFDLFLVGEAEAILEPFLARWGAHLGESREALTDAMAELPGALMPAKRAHWIWSGDKGPLCAEVATALPDTRSWRIADSAPARQPLVSPDTPVRSVPWDGIALQPSAARFPEGTALGPAYLLELARGCPRRCRFCAPMRIYAPLRECPSELLLERAHADLRPGETVGLMSLSAGDYTDLEKLTGSLAGMDVRLSISSLPAAFSRERVVKDIVGSGATTLTLAPETGTDRLRALIGKPIRNEAILRSASMLERCGVRRLRTYFIIGLPFEREEDIAGIAKLLASMREALPSGCSLSATVNAFVPKPRTPFQWAPMAPLEQLRDRARQLRRATPPGVRLRIKGFREARRQALLARGDVTWGPRLARMAREGMRPEAVLREDGTELEPLVGSIRPDSPLPWGYLIGKEDRTDLVRDWQEAQAQAR